MRDERARLRAKLEPLGQLDRKDIEARVLARQFRKRLGSLKWPSGPGAILVMQLPFTVVTVWGLLTGNAWLLVLIRNAAIAAGLASLAVWLASIAAGRLRGEAQRRWMVNWIIVILCYGVMLGSGQALQRMTSAPLLLLLAVFGLFIFACLSTISYTAKAGIELASMVSERS